MVPTKHLPRRPSSQQRLNCFQICEHTASLLFGLFPRLAVIAFSAMVSSQVIAQSTTPKVGEFAPNFSLKTLDDRTIELTALEVLTAAK